jgi:NADH-ubiquinone oxidoreductase chain 4
VAGSMILAGVLLKLGGYGIMRVMPLVYRVVFNPSGYFVGLRLMGIVYVGGLCCRLNDFKALVAYSSVAHMSMVIRGCVSMNFWGYVGSFIIIVSHGLSSSGLFCIVNMFYERFGSRSFYVNRGLILIFPSLSLMMFILVAANIAAPPTVNLLSEIFLMVGIIGYDVMIVLVFPLGSFLGAVFSIFMYSFRQHGQIYGNGLSFIMVRFRELHCLSLHALPVNLIILGSFLFLAVNI